VVALLVAGAVALGSTVGVRQWKLFRARHDVSELVIALNAYTIKFSHPPEGTTDEICAVLRGEDVRGQNPNHEAAVDSYVMNAAGEFVDPWATSYRILTRPEQRVYSCGPNRIDERGEGDDIANWKR
jgi:hypothetical protein